MNGDPYPEIGRLVAASITGGWVKAVVRAEIGEDWGQFSAESHDAKGRAHDLPLKNTHRLLELLQQVRTITKEVGRPVPADWTKVTFTLMRDGKFEIQFGYDTL